MLKHFSNPPIIESQDEARFNDIQALSKFAKKYHGGSSLSIDDIQNSAASGRLIVVLGAGVSIALTSKSHPALSWKDLIKNGLDYAADRGLATQSQRERNVAALDSSDMDDLLGVAEFVGRKLDSPNGQDYARWLKSVFENWSVTTGAMSNALKAMSDSRIPIATLNYDTLVESVTGLTALDFMVPSDVLSWARKEHQAILHLHGVFTNPKSCVFGIRDYQSTLSDEARNAIQRSLGSLNRFLFIGCGGTFGDPNFSALIQWLRSHFGAGAPQHYSLVLKAEYANKLSDATWRGFVEPISFGEDHKDLPEFLLKLFPSRVEGRKRKDKQTVSANHEVTLNAYRSFLLRDCGEMTIEGMRADLDVGQRKFDLEKLFVPLELTSFPPAIPTSDPDRDAKLHEWKLNNSSPLQFSKAFSKQKAMALLALPGGGKTMLLKRLAVAYAAPNRRSSSLDELPALNLFPIMIRCREWKEHIRKPILVLLGSLELITGEPMLNGMIDAIGGLLKQGSVLLLVDGLDEIHNDADRAVFVNNLETFIKIYPKTRIVITSREAGFDLVAPGLSRFCTKFRIASLNKIAIESLCHHWHALMGNNTNLSRQEGEAIAETLINSSSLRRLAENPLLLTMLLVVKHAAGRLPPDLVNLYQRAVEILLDTWNIQGHDPLNPREAVPQLACLAYELLSQGKQTATEREIVEILQSARDRLTIIGRYAKDSPHDFLKRVELRSSLLLEGGHTSENGRLVPFYQFRHLTFQEYLAAVASVERFVIDENKRESPYAALAGNLLADEWKEVVPMAAVLGRSQSIPILDALIEIGEKEWTEALSDNNVEPFHADQQFPPATNRLAKAMAEEAFFPQDSATKAARLVAGLSRGCRTQDNWQALSRGPYGKDLRSAAMEVYLHQDNAGRLISRNTVALLEAFSLEENFWIKPESVDFLISLIGKKTPHECIRGLLSTAGSFWISRDKAAGLNSLELYQRIEELLFDNDPKVVIAAAWAWSFWRYLQRSSGNPYPIPSKNLVENFVSMFASSNINSDSQQILECVFPAFNDVPRNYSSVTIDTPRVKKDLMNINTRNMRGFGWSDRADLIRLAFISDGAFSDTELFQIVSKIKLHEYEEDQVSDILSYLSIKKVSRHRGSRSKRLR